ncbi:MAG: M15 family metallopeptidase [Bacteroides sp.]|nr:M15 family metallopeptidase [Bacteroides sp.]MCM1447800.1 M15 family metallopeptidase [Bacteroides sp.]MCM1516093.1 M15 family metallopeptidase [Paraprevotella sp.]
MIGAVWQKMGLWFMLVLMLVSVQAGAQIFEIAEVPDSIWDMMQGRSCPKGHDVNRLELRYLRLAHYDFDGGVRQGEMICNRLIADDIVYIFRCLYEARYPIACMRLIDEYGADDLRSMAANNTSCFCYRAVAGSKKLSRHSLGMAVDINPLYNPCLYVRSGKVVPSEGAAYASNRDKRRDIPGKIDHTDLCFRLFTERGFRWGGDWRTLKDYQHFEK